MANEVNSSLLAVMSENIKLSRAVGKVTQAAYFAAVLRDLLFPGESTRPVPQLFSGAADRFEGIDPAD